MVSYSASSVDRNRLDLGQIFVTNNIDLSWLKVEKSVPVHHGPVHSSFHSSKQTIPSMADKDSC